MVKVPGPRAVRCAFSCRIGVGKKAGAGAVGFVCYVPGPSVVPRKRWRTRPSWAGRRC